MQCEEGQVEEDTANLKLFNLTTFTALAQVFVALPASLTSVR